MRYLNIAANPLKLPKTKCERIRMGLKNIQAALDDLKISVRHHRYLVEILRKESIKKNKENHGTKKTIAG